MNLAVFHRSKFGQVVAQVCLLLLAAALSGCTTGGGSRAEPGAARISEEMLLDSSPIAANAAMPELADIEILDLSPQMIEFVEQNVGGGLNPPARLHRLLVAVLGEENFELQYDDSTRTASQTFRDHRGNCLSFTNMFLAMARYLDLEANYQEVEVPPDWSLDGESFLLSKHVNVFLDLGIMERVVDFNGYDFKISFDKNIISDERGRAHYFNNLGVEHMFHGDSVVAYAHFRQSLREDRFFSPAWVNLGILHRREGYPDYAETAYRKALKTEGNNLVAMSNLANLYYEMGRLEEAEKYEKRVESHRMRNPYYRYMLANADFTNGDYRSAIEHLEYAIDKRDNEDRFFSLMGMNYMMLGDRESARHWMAKAEEAALTDASRRRYQNKLDLLVGRPQGY